MTHHRPVVLLILDGWGYREDPSFNAIAAAQKPQWDNWWRHCPHLLLNASGTAVGLPEDQMGNSEVGHMHMGAGRLIQQELTRINEAIKTKTFDQNPIILNTINSLKKNKRALHIMGLFSPGGVHSHEDHLFALLDLCDQHHFNHIYLHLFLDGRDTPPQSALQSLEKLNSYLNNHPVATIQSISGRYYALDRDQRWERLEPVYRLLTEAYSPYQFDTASNAIKAFYQKGIIDEFIPPTQIGHAIPIQEGDGVLFFNYRADRARQLTQAFIDNTFTGFNRVKKLNLNCFISMTHYADNLKTSPLFPSQSLQNTLGEVLANHHLHQLRISETEKYAHVTFFFNGGQEAPFPYEDRILIPSPSVATYDLQPKMSGPQLTQTMVNAILQSTYDVIICNYPNADMVGHTGNFEATVEAIEYLDKAMHTIGEAVQKVGGQLLITADHGNAECMFNPTTHQAHTAHTNLSVPLIYIGQHWYFNSKQGSLIDIAPTILALLGITPPKEMTGTILLSKQ